MQATEPNLLIADDDRDFRESLGEVFRRRGYRTTLAADGCEAIEIVKESKELHLVLLDVHMPRLSGLQTLEQIRLGFRTGLPCILMSAKLDDEIVRQAHELEISSVLSKPFTLRVVTAAVDEILRTSYGWAV